MSKVRMNWPEGTFMRLVGRGRLLDSIEAANLSRRELAFLACCSKGMIDHLLSGRRKTCTPELATRICWSLRVPLDYLFAEEREADTPPSSSVPAVSTPRRVVSTQTSVEKGER